MFDDPIYSHAGTLGLDTAMAGLRLPIASGVRGGTVEVPLYLDATGREVAFMASIHFVTANLTNPRVTAGGGANGWILTVNDIHAAAGKLVILMDTDPLSPLPTGSHHMATITFDIPSTATPGATGLNFASDPRPLSTADGMANAVVTAYQNGHVVILANASDNPANYPVAPLHFEPIGYQGSIASAPTPNPGGGGSTPLPGGGGSGGGTPAPGGGGSTTLPGNGTGTPDNTIFGFSPIVVIAAAAVGLWLYSKS